MLDVLERLGNHHAIERCVAEGQPQGIAVGPTPGDTRDLSFGTEGVHHARNILQHHVVEVRRHDVCASFQSFERMPTRSTTEIQ